MNDFDKGFMCGSAWTFLFLMMGIITSVFAK